MRIRTRARGGFEAEHQVLLAVIVEAARAGFDAHAWQIPWALENVLRRRGRWHDMQAAYSTALAAARRLGDLVGQAHVLRGLGRACAHLGLVDEGRGHLAEALSLFGGAGR